MIWLKSYGLVEVLNRSFVLVKSEVCVSPVVVGNVKSWVDFASFVIGGDRLNVFTFCQCILPLCVERLSNIYCRTALGAERGILGYFVLTFLTM